eukprot:3624103-Pyramimonas_sp.AAC.1
MLALDLMRIVDLGISQLFAGAVLMRLVEHNFALSRASTVAIRRTHNIVHLRRRLKSWYIQQKAAHPRGSHSIIQKLTLKMLGDVN